MGFEDHLPLQLPNPNVSRRHELTLHYTVEFKLRIAPQLAVNLNWNIKVLVYFCYMKYGLSNVNRLQNQKIWKKFS